jgi:hypothetical protein
MIKWILDFMRKAKTALGCCRPRSQAVTLHDLQESEARIIAAFNEAESKQIEKQMRLLRESTERLDAAVKKQKSG